MKKIIQYPDALQEDLQYIADDLFNGNVSDLIRLILRDAVYLHKQDGEYLLNVKLIDKNGGRR